MTAGRYAPSPSGDLHLGNLRTAMLAWLFARSEGRSFRLRIDDLDRVRPGAAERQLADLDALGLDWDEPVLRQSEVGYDDVVDELTARGMTYECFCSRREIAEAPRAPHAPPGSYPGTCRDLTEAERRQRRNGRPPAIRLRSEAGEFTINDRRHGQYTGVVDDFVLRRNDGVPAYNLTTVIDDARLDVGQVVRGDDLLSSTPRQAYLAGLLGHDVPEFAHVPLVLNPAGVRLAKRDGAVTLTELAGAGWSPGQVRTLLARSLEFTHGPSSSMTDLLDGFDPDRLPRDPWVLDPATLATGPDRLTP